MREVKRAAVSIVLVLVASAAMYLAVFIEYATSATGDYRFLMTIGLFGVLFADALLFWVFANGKSVARFAAASVSAVGSAAVLLDWLVRGPSVFGLR
jgi:hypothetical protein